MPVPHCLLAATLALCVMGGGLASGPAGRQEQGPDLEQPDLEQLCLHLERDWRTAAQGGASAEPELAGFGRRFLALADVGSGRARLWLIENWRAAHGLDPLAPLRARDLGAKLGLARDLVREHAHQATLLAPRFLAWLQVDPDLSGPECELLARGLAGTARDPELAAGALLALARRLAPVDCEDPELQADARELLEELRLRWPRSAVAKLAAEELWRLENLAVGCQAPEFIATDARGNRLRSSHLRGRVVVVNVWRFGGKSWQARLPQERRLRLRWWDERFTWLGVNLNPDADTFRRDCDDRDIDWKQHAWEGGEDTPVCDAWHVGDRPYLVLLDDQGIVRGVNLDPDVLEARVATLLSDLREKIVQREIHHDQEDASAGR